MQLQLRMIASEVAVVGTAYRDELAADIVHDSGFFDSLLNALVREHSCVDCNLRDPTVVALDAQLANLFASCLQLTIAGDQSKPGYAPTSACEALVNVPALEDLSDDDLTACFANNSGALHVREDFARFLASYHHDAHH